MIASSSALAASDDCALPSLAVQPPSPIDASRPQDAVIAQAEILARDGSVDAAEKLYAALLGADPPDVRGGAGLAYVAGARQAARNLVASAPEADDPTECYENALGLDDANADARAGLAAEKRKAASDAQEAKGVWDDFYSHSLMPLADLLLPVLVVLTVLLVITRLSTPVVGPEVVAWGEVPRRWVWRAGMLLLILAGLRLVAQAAWPDWRVEQFIPPHVRFGVLGVLLAGVVAAVAAARRRPRDLVWMAIPLAIGLALSIFGVQIKNGQWPWALALGAAALGVVFLASGWGHALRLQVRVQKAGKADLAGAAHVLGALQELGSSPPRGLKTPQQVDVQDLPSTALDALPASKITIALKTLVDQFVPSTPWRAIIEDAEGDRLVLTLTRNGAVARTVAIDPAFFGIPQQPTTAASADSIPEESAAENTATAAGDDDMDALLTAAAAIVLTELAQRHHDLRIGLCGATQWDSVAAHVIATRPGASNGPQVGELLTRSVQRDPNNALARAAYIGHVGTTAATPEAFTALADRLGELWSALPAPGSEEAAGYTALHLRTAHSLTAVWLNIASFEALPVERRTIAWCTSNRWYGSLCDLIQTSVGLSGGDGLFARAMHTVAGELREALAVLAPDGIGVPVPPQALPDPPPPTLQALYDQACVEVKKGNLEKALGLLSFVASTQYYRDAAWADPWFAILRAEGGDGALADARKRFEVLVGPAEKSYLDKADFGQKKQLLLDLGITSAEDLLEVTSSRRARAELAHTVDVPRSLVDVWRERAQAAIEGS
jgi:hypothetical protein